MIIQCVVNLLSWDLGPVDTSPVTLEDTWYLRSYISPCICSMDLFNTPSIVIAVLVLVLFSFSMEIFLLFIFNLMVYITTKLIRCILVYLITIDESDDFYPRFGLYPRPLPQPSLTDPLPLPPYFPESLPPYLPLPIHLPIFCTLLVESDPGGYLVFTSVLKSCSY